LKRGASSLVLFVAALAGACTMAVELAAVRLLAPWFGTSSAVWTNVIGVILLGLSVGYMLGARLSASADPARKLAFTLCFAAALAAWLPGLSAPAARAFLPEGLTLDEAGELLSWGSLATALVLFLPSTLLLGCVAPLCTEVLQRIEHGSAGHAGGRVLCASTLGSLAGTFATTYVLVPRAGLTLTFLSAGAALFACALIAFFVLHKSTTPRATALAAVVPFLAALPLSRAPAPQVRDEMKLLDARESTYQSLRVVQSGDLRFLQVNESFDSFQSVWQQQPGLLPPPFYYNAFVLPLWWAQASGRWRVAVLGLGAGTTWRVMEGAKPDGVTIAGAGVEIDPVAVELAHEWLDLAPDRADRRVLAGWDARVALRALEPGLDQIVLDAYANQMEIPPHLSSREFFAEARAKLVDGGYMCVNVGGFGFDDPVVVAIARTLASAFEARVLVLRIPFSRNFAVFARRGAEPPEPGGVGWRTRSDEINARLEPLSLEGAWRWFERGDARVGTDDRNDIEALQRRSVLDAGEKHEARP
jgi:predicted membrane-bound spermidine synthase